MGKDTHHIVITVQSHIKVVLYLLQMFIMSKIHVCDLAEYANDTGTHKGGCSSDIPILSDL